MPPATHTESKLDGKILCAGHLIVCQNIENIELSEQETAPEPGPSATKGQGEADGDAGPPATMKDLVSSTSLEAASVASTKVEAPKDLAARVCVIIYTYLSSHQL